MVRATSCVKVLSSLVPVLVRSPFPHPSCPFTLPAFILFSPVLLHLAYLPYLPPRVFFAYLDQFLVLDRFCLDLPLLNRTCSACSVCIWVQLLSYRFWHNGRKQVLNQKRFRMCESLSKWTWNSRQPRNVQDCVWLKCQWEGPRWQYLTSWEQMGLDLKSSKVWCRHSRLQEDESWLFSWHCHCFSWWPNCCQTDDLVLRVN